MPTNATNNQYNLAQPNNNNNNNNNSINKSPPKKHVAIAPRTPEIKQQQQQAAALKNLGIANNTTNMTGATTRLSATATNNQLKPQAINKLNTTANNTNGNVLTTTTNGGGNMANTATPTTPTFYQLPVQLPNLVQLPQLFPTTNGASIMQINNMAAAAAAAKATAAVTATTAAQAAQAAQYLFNGTVFKLHQITAAQSTTTTGATNTTLAATTNPFNLLNVNDLQDLWLKQQQQQQQQQPSTNNAANNANNGASFQEVFQQQILAALANQQQVQQQQQLQRLNANNMQQQPVFMATPAGLLFNAASLPAMLAQAAAAIAVNNNVAAQQTQLPQAPQQQQQQQRAQQHLKQPALPALQPIQQNSAAAGGTTTTTVPALSSIFATSGQQEVNDLQLRQQVINYKYYNCSNFINNHCSQFQFQQQQQQQFTQLALAQQQQQLQQQFINSTQPPPLSAVTLGNNNNNNNNNNSVTINSNSNNSLNKTLTNNNILSMTASVNNNNNNNLTNNTTTSTSLQNVTTTPKLAIVKATQNCQYTALNSQPPPLVTISNIKPRATTASTATSTANNSMLQQKPSVLAKPYQKRLTPTKVNKINTNNGKIIVTPTTPPPLVPAISHKIPLASTPPLVSLATSIITTTNTLQKSVKVNTPALVALSVAATPITTAANVAIVAASPMTILPPINKNNNSVSSKTAQMNNADLFDLVKNSKGAISITLANNNDNCNNNVNTAKPTIYESEINEEKSNAVNRTTSKLTNIDEDDKPLKEIVNARKECEADIDMKADMNSDSSLSGYSSHSVSSAADLSLEASTPGSSNVSSPASNHLCSQEDNNLFATPTVVMENSSTVMSAGGASNQDMLSELVTSSCVSMSPTNTTLSESDTVDEPPLKRNVTTPESGIGGSLSNCESNSSSVSGMSSTSVQCSSIVANLSTETSVSSPLATASNVPSPVSPADTCNDTTMTNLSSNDTTLSAINNNNNNNNSCLSLFNTSTFSSVNSSCSFANFSTMSSTTPTTIEMSFLDDSNLTANSNGQKSAISPILSQPKTIRFPASRHGPKGAKRHHDGVCYWHQCNKKHESNSKLLDHMQSHVNSQTGPYSCLWVGCKVYNKESCSRRWLERHVLSHGGTKQFKCIVEGCGLRFGSQVCVSFVLEFFVASGVSI